MTPQRGASNCRVLFWSARAANVPMSRSLSASSDWTALPSAAAAAAAASAANCLVPDLRGGATSSSGTTIAAQQRQVTVKRAEWMCAAGDARLGDGAEVRYELVALDSYSLVVKRPDPYATRQYECTSSRVMPTPVSAMTSRPADASTKRRTCASMDRSVRAVMIEPSCIDG